MENAWNTLLESRPDASEIVKILGTMKAPEPEEAPAEPAAPPGGKIQRARGFLKRALLGVRVAIC